MIGTFPQMLVDRLEARIKELEDEVKNLVFLMNGGDYRERPLDNPKKYVFNKVEGEGEMGDYGDV